MSIRHPVADHERNKWAVAVDVEEVLRGTPMKQIEVYVHSPSREFGVNAEEYKGRPCIWAFVHEKGELVQKTAPFPFQFFNAADVELLRSLLKEADQLKKQD